MLRQIKTAEQMQAIVSERIHQIYEVRTDGGKVGVPIPIRHEPDDRGCNWEMRHFRYPRPYADAIASVVAQARKEFNLP